jgi:hypothetical protein
MQNPGAGGNTESLTAASQKIELHGIGSLQVVVLWEAVAKMHTFAETEFASDSLFCFLSAFEALKTVSFPGRQTSTYRTFPGEKRADFSLSFLRSLLRC